jgi:hypothetical protein
MWRQKKQVIVTVPNVVRLVQVRYVAVAMRSSRIITLIEKLGVR